MLSTALSEAMASVRQATAHGLSAAESSRITEALARTLMEAHDAGERNPDILKSAALRQVFAPPTAH